MKKNNKNCNSKKKPEKLKEEQSYKKGSNKRNRNKNFDVIEQIPEPASKRKKSQVSIHISPASLENNNLNCYLNSAFQGISASNIFVKEINDLYEKYKAVNLIQLERFKKLIDNLNNYSKIEIDISKNALFSLWNKSGEQDSYELLAYALNQVYNELRKQLEKNGDISKNDLKSWIMYSLPMRYVIQYSIKCECGALSFSPFQSDLAFHVTIPKGKEIYHLNDLLDLFFENDLIEDYKCDIKSCTASSAERSAKLFKPLPKTFCVHLQRTYWNGLTIIKINKVVEFDTKLIIKRRFMTNKEMNSSTFNNDLIDTNDVSNVTAEGTLMNNVSHEQIQKDLLVSQSPLGSDFEDNNNYDFSKMSKTLNEDVKESENCLDKKNRTKRKPIISAKRSKGKVKKNEKKNGTNKDDEVYDLVSVIEHCGQVSTGHYICYKKVEELWFETNDSYVRKVSKETVMKCQAYILFYEKLNDHS